MCVVLSSALPKTHVVSPVQNFHLFLCAFFASVPSAQMVEAFPCGPWTFVTIRNLFMNVNIYIYIYMFISYSNGILLYYDKHYYEYTQ